MRVVTAAMRREWRFVYACGVQEKRANHTQPAQEAPLYLPSLSPSPHPLSQLSEQASPTSFSLRQSAPSLQSSRQLFQQSLPVPEVLAPAGNLATLKTAIDFGADAVYAGGQAFGMRSAPKNFTLEDFECACSYAHQRNARVYVTANILPNNDEVEPMNEYIGQLADIGVDAIIVSDIGVLMQARRIAPHLDIHISTQAGVTNYQTACALAELGARRVVLARELDLPSIRQLRARVPKNVEIEAFVHGSMCMETVCKPAVGNIMW